MASQAEYEQAMDAWYAEQEARGPLAGAPDFIACYECAGFPGHGVEVPVKRVVKLGAVVGRQDPTQTYVLACGHVTI